MKNFLLFGLLFCFSSCAEEASVDKSASSPEIRNDALDYRLSLTKGAVEVLENNQNLTVSQILTEYKNVTHDNEVVRSNSKAIILSILVERGFLESASLDDVEYLIIDQNSSVDNIATINVNYELFYKALEKGSKLDLIKLSNEFVSKNRSYLEFETFSEKNEKLILLGVNAQNFYTCLRLQR